jgi:hypothetical protein
LITHQIHGSDADLRKGTDMNFVTILSVIGAVLVFAVPIIFTVISVLKLKRKKKSLRFELFAFTVGIFMVVLAYALLEPVYYQEALNAENGPLLHEAFNRNYLLSLLTFWGIGLLFYFILKYAGKTFPPIVEAMLLSGVYIGILISLLTVIQLSAGYRADYVYVLMVSYISLFLLNYLLLTVNLLIGIAKEKAKHTKDIDYKNPFLNRCSRWLKKGVNLYLGAVILLIPLLAVLILILLLFGQVPDSAISAFTQTSDWLLSTKASPPAIESGGHYLCTVSLRGHKRLVKPLRYGIRNGKKIVVNRQLCIANAFEQLLMEKTPRFHTVVRNFYDTYGYPVSIFIKKAWTADLVYLIMKPLEWLFLMVLYCFDSKPEDRIAGQYLPNAPVK